MKVNFSVDNKQLAWIEAYSMAIGGAAVFVCKDGVDPHSLHATAVALADAAVAALERRMQEWK